MRRRNYKRDRIGRFARVLGGSQVRRGRKIARLTGKNKRVIKQYTQDKSLHGTPLGLRIENNIVKRQIKIADLKGKKLTPGQKRQLFNNVAMNKTL
jgi:hypothetical protein